MKAHKKNKDSLKPTPDQIKEASGKISGYFGGYIAIWTIDIGIRTGLFQTIAKSPRGMNSPAVARKTGFDPLYTDVWCRNAYGAELLEMQGDRYFLSPAMNTLLLDRNSPSYSAGTAQVFIGLRDAFASLREMLKTGKRLWWDTAPREFVDAVAESSRAFYTRLLNFIGQKPELAHVLNNGTLLEVGCGYGTGLIRFASRFPKAKFVGVDGDLYSLKQTKALFKQAKITKSARFVKSSFENFNESRVADIALINISLHEARDKKKAALAMYNSLKPGGIILVSEFPYPEKSEGLRNLPARVMSGIQYFEAMIDDQLLSTREFIDLLEQVGFKNIETVELTPVHVVILGYK